jgi:hypothetical protein
LSEVKSKYRGNGTCGAVEARGSVALRAARLALDTGFGERVGKVARRAICNAFLSGNILFVEKKRSFLEKIKMHNLRK